jgi:hypothetical protein
MSNAKFIIPHLLSRFPNLVTIELPDLEISGCDRSIISAITGHGRLREAKVEKLSGYESDWGDPPASERLMLLPPSTVLDLSQFTVGHASIIDGGEVEVFHEWLRRGCRVTSVYVFDLRGEVIPSPFWTTIPMIGLEKLTIDGLPRLGCWTDENAFESFLSRCPMLQHIEMQVYPSHGLSDFVVLQKFNSEFGENQLNVQNIQLDRIVTDYPPTMKCSSVRLAGFDLGVDMEVTSLVARICACFPGVEHIKLQLMELLNPWHMEHLLVCEPSHSMQV